MSAVAESTSRPWSLRPYQIEALRAISGAWAAGVRATLLVSATGTGKTTIIAEVLRRRRDAGRGRALVIAHRLELLAQLAERCRMIGLDPALECGESRAPHVALAGTADVVVATVQTLRGARLDGWHERSFGTVVVDESHRAVGATYRAILDRFAPSDLSGARVLGVTATPDRGDEVALGHIFGAEPCYSYDLRRGIEEGYLAPIRATSVAWPSVDLSSVRVTKQEHGRDLSADDLAQQARTEAALHEIAKPFVDLHGGRQSLIFVPSVETAHALASVLAGYLGADLVSALDGTSPAELRARTIADYRAGRLRVLVNCALFTEGFDAPETACVAIARPTKSRALFTQMVGRGTRIAPGKTDLLVLSFEPSNDDHSLIAPIDLLAGKDLDELDRERLRATRSDGEDVLRRLHDVEEQKAEQARRQERDRRGARLQVDVRYRTARRDPFGELGLDGEVGRSRGPRATDAQIEALRKIGFDLGKTPSRGEASSLLNEITSRRRKGLCSLKQMRQLAARGLRTDLSFAEAGEAMTALASANWRMTSSIAQRWGA